METDEILAQVSATREGVANAIGHIEDGKERVQEVMRLSVQRFNQLTEQFDDLRGHLQSEAGRAAEAAAKVLEAFSRAQNWASTAASQHGQALGQLAHHCEEGSSANGDGTDTLGQHRETVRARREAGMTLFDELLTEANSGHSRHGEALQEFQSQLTAWREATENDATTQRDAVQKGVESDVTGARTEFGQTLETAVDHTRQEVEAREQELSDHTRQEMDRVTQEENGNRNEVTQGIEAMRDALQQLGELVTTTSNTMSQGAKDVTDLMDATSVGLDVTIGLIDNLSQIFEEIESAWRG
ncbi:hypothetical protein ACFQ1E_20250 [Sphingomonas canadensis]|uniref:Methyl-accepting transducer domain-containing protein n=1 Tax=Sphingomonas canadensis TaxID=1219257 RepID=A0ABW3HB86_9SPHN|nr:hypothetical protein [Sphingomonas canadensis]MCW3838410.1 hypothetical protein [Sphingomonas canadensis]